MRDMLTLHFLMNLVGIQSNKRKMLVEIEIPGSDNLTFEHLALDYYGTIAEDGRFFEGIEEPINLLINPVRLQAAKAQYLRLGFNLSQQ